MFVCFCTFSFDELIMLVNCQVSKQNKKSKKQKREKKYRKAAVRTSRKARLTVRSNMSGVGCVFYEARRAGNTCCIVKRRNKIRGARYASQILSAPLPCGTSYVKTLSEFVDERLSSQYSAEYNHYR